MFYTSAVMVSSVFDFIGAVFVMDEPVAFLIPSYMLLFPVLHVCTGKVSWVSVCPLVQTSKRLL